MLQKLGTSHDVKSFAIGSLLECLVVRLAKFANLTTFIFI